MLVLGWMGGVTLDIVISGPDMSGTSTQIRDVIGYFEGKGLVVRDLRGREFDAQFHAERFKVINKEFFSLESFEESMFAIKNDAAVYDFYREARSLPMASCVKNDVSTYIDPSSADVWILEEPTHRSPLRLVDMNMSKFHSSHDPSAQSYSYGVDRYHEYYRFRKPLLEAGKIVVRSRSEESAAYQVRDEEHLPGGLPHDGYLNIPGNALGFKSAPTDIFVVHAPIDWSADEYRRLKEERSDGRDLDDHEMNIPYQLLVNRRYGSRWLEDLYEQASSLHGGAVPRIHRIPMYDEKRKPASKEVIREQVWGILEDVFGKPSGRP